MSGGGGARSWWSRPTATFWARRVITPWETDNRWGILVPDAVFPGILDLPAELTVTGIGSDYGLGITAEELDVLRVQLPPIRW